MAASTETNPELKTYTGNCHCGAFKFTLKVPEITDATSCNCSICSAKGMLYLFPGKKEAINIERGEDSLRTYTFGSNKLIHKVHNHMPLPHPPAR